jgi:hypothetical protein
MSTNSILATAPLVTTNFLLRATGTTIGNSLIFDNGTNVGIGNQGTTYKLEVTGTFGSGAITSTGQFNLTPTSGSSWLYLTQGTSSNTAYISWLNPSGNRIGYLGSSATNISLALENSANFVVTGGNVGIGTVSPVSTNLVGSQTIVKSYNSDTPVSTTAQTYYTNQSNLYLFGRNAGISIICPATSEEGSIFFGNSLSVAYASINTGSGTTSVGGDMVFRVGSNTERMRITSTGVVTTTNNISMTGTNAQLLQTTANSIAGDNAAVFYNSNANSYGVYIGAGSGTNHSLFCTDSTRTANLFKVQGNGNVGIGIDPLAKFVVHCGTNQNLRISSENSQTSISAVNDPINAFGFLNIDANVIRMQGINTGGNVSIGTATDFGYKLNLNGQPGCNGFTLWTNWSDVRLKENIVDFDGNNVLDKISKIRPVTYNYNELSGFDEETRARRISGFIAQELMEVFPDMVGTIKKEDVEYYDTNLSNLNLYLVKAIQELSKQNEELSNRLIKLESK